MSASNRLPALAADISSAYAEARLSAAALAEAALKAGAALVEAKSLVKHGEWGVWLRSHCAMSERTARRYMRLHHEGLDSATVAVFGIRGMDRELSRRRDDLTDLAIDSAIGLLRFAGEKPTPLMVASLLTEPDLEQHMEAIVRAADSRIFDLAEGAR